MTYCRKELYLLKDFDFNIIEPKKDSTPQDKFLIVLDVINNDNGIFCLTTSLTGKNSSLIVPQLISQCTSITNAHFFKFDDCNICDSYSFDLQTYVQGMPSNVFEKSIATLFQKYNVNGKAEKVGKLKDDVFLSLISCLCQSKYLDRNLKKRLHEIGDEESSQPKNL